MFKSRLILAAMAGLCSEVGSIENNAAGGMPVPSAGIDPQAQAATPTAPAVPTVDMSNFDSTVQLKEYKFGFKSQKILDSEGKETGESTKRPTVELKIPVLTLDGIVKILSEGKGPKFDLVFEALEDVIATRARDIISENENITNQSNFPIDELTWEKIANLPKGERRGGGIAKELWEEFFEDYIKEMPAIAGKTKEQVVYASKIFSNKFATVKNNKKVLQLLKTQLGLYMQSASKAESFKECLEFLLDKIEKLFKLDGEDVLSNL